MLSKESNYLLNYWQLEESKSIADQKINKLKLKNADKKKIDRWMNESNAMSMKMSDISKRYSKNREDINKLFNEIVNDKDVVKAATNRNKNKKKFTDPNGKKLYGPTYTKTTYYVY